MSQRLSRAAPAGDVDAPAAPATAAAPGDVDAQAGGDAVAPCPRCAPRGWLLAELSGWLDCVCPDRERLRALLALEDEELVRSARGPRGAREKRRARVSPEMLRSTPGVRPLCRHRGGLPASLGFPGAPRLLHVAGRLDRWDELTEGPVVAVVGSGRASDYGVEVARSLGRGLAAAGVTVAAMLADGVCAAALGGCVEVGGGCLCAHPGGVDVGCAGRRRGLCERVRRHGCAIAELPCGTTPRRWGAPASERVAVGLAAVTVLVEAREQKRELAPARLAEALGRPVGAIPGRLTSPLSAGTNTLLAEGAHLIRGAADVLELLHTSEPGPTRPPSPPRSAAAGLAPRLRSVLDRVGSGEDTADRVTASSADPADVLLALTELEVLGLLARGDGGRYVVRGPLPAD